MESRVLVPPSKQIMLQILDNNYLEMYWIRIEKCEQYRLLSNDKHRQDCGTSKQRNINTDQSGYLMEINAYASSLFHETIVTIVMSWKYHWGCLPNTYLNINIFNV